MNTESNDFGQEFSDLYKEAEIDNFDSALNYKIESDRYEIYEVVASGGMKIFTERSTKNVSVLWHWRLPSRI